MMRTLPSFESLVEQMSNSPSQRRRRRAAQDLRKFGTRAVEPLCQALKDSARGVRVIAADSLGHIRDGRAVEPLCVALEDKERNVRAAAAKALGDIGDARAAEPLLETLNDKEVTVRAAAVKALGQTKDARAIELLCPALEDRNRSVRFAAAEGLVHLSEHFGDARAVQPLLKALRECFVGGSARWQLAVGLVIIPLVVIALFTGAALAGTAGSLGGIWVAISNYYKERRRVSKLCQSIADTLARIAERDPTPELRAALPDLQAVAADALQQDKQTRATARQVAQRIDALTEKLKSLPLPASAPVPDTATLPRPADAPAPNVETLPRVEG